ncbi:MAG: YdcF family protein [Anaerolineae bacterium]|nr:YdcF family protein [Anaerolineae bacterium]
MGAVLAIWTMWTLSGRYNQAIYTPDELSVIPDQQVAIVFGAGYWPNGVLSLILRERLEGAIELYEAGRVQKLLFSGDNRIAEYNEPAVMLAYTLERNIPREDIILDYAGRRTYDTCYRARDIFGLSRATLVTQRYHLPRALVTCGALGLEVVGYSANRYQHQGWYLIRYRLREIPALWLAWWETHVTHPTPVLGEPLPIFSG